MSSSFVCTYLVLFIHLLICLMHDNADLICILFHSRNNTRGYWKIELEETTVEHVRRHTRDAEVLALRNSLHN